MYLGGTSKKGFRFFAPCFGLAAIYLTNIEFYINYKESLILFIYYILYIYVQSLVVVEPTKMYVVRPDLRLFLPYLFDSLAAVI